MAKLHYIHDMIPWTIKLSKHQIRNNGKWKFISHVIYHENKCKNYLWFQGKQIWCLCSICQKIYFIYMQKYSHLWQYFVVILVIKIFWLLSSILYLIFWLDTKYVIHDIPSTYLPITILNMSIWLSSRAMDKQKFKFWIKCIVRDW